MDSDGNAVACLEDIAWGNYVCHANTLAGINNQMHTVYFRAILHAVKFPSVVYFPNLTHWDVHLFTIYFERTLLVCRYREVKSSCYLQ